MRNGGRDDVPSTFRDELRAEALAICEGRWSDDVSEPRIAYLRARLALRLGLIDDALIQFACAHGMGVREHSLYLDISDACVLKSRYGDALNAGLRALTLAPTEGECFAYVGRALRLMGRAAEAHFILREGLLVQPHEPCLHVELGDSLSAMGNHGEAINHYNIALASRPGDPRVHHRLGTLHAADGKWREALDTYRRASRYNEDATLKAAEGDALLRLGQNIPAEEAFHSALNLAPLDVDINRRFVRVLESMNHCRDAAGAWLNLGRSLERIGQLPAAAFAYDRTLAAGFRQERASVALARVQARLGKTQRALETLRHAVTVAPQSVEAHVALGRALQVVGDFETSWDELAWYHHRSQKHWRRVEQPVCDGTAVEGRRILLWADANMSAGDVVMFLRAASLLQSLGARVTVECSAAHVALARLVVGVDRAVPFGNCLVPFDQHAPLMYLPALVRRARCELNTSSVPNDGVYLRPSSTAVVRKEPPPHRERLIGVSLTSDNDDPVQVAVAWKMLPVAIQSQRDRIVGLERDAERMPRRTGHLQVEPGLRRSATLVELTTLIARMDLVITVDSVVAHLAGALGRPVCVLVPSGAGWPWPATGFTTWWYPTMSVYRQSSNGDWSVAMRAIRESQTSLRPEE